LWSAVQEDWDSEFMRFPRLFQGHESIPGLTWPTTTFNDRMTVYLGKRRVDLMHLGRAHTAGDIVACARRGTSCSPATSSNTTRRVIAATVISTTGRRHWKRSAPTMLKRSRRAAAMRWSAAKWSMQSARRVHRDFVDFHLPARSPGWPSARRHLKEAWDACRAECDPKFKDYAIYEHCLPFNVARAYDEALGIDTPRIWTAERDAQMWADLQG
jgi:hypothetical protein